MSEHAIDPGLAPLVLVCTVGGSPAPIRTAISALRPDRVVFVVSDGRAGSPSSRSQVEETSLDPERGREGGIGLRFALGCPADVQVREVPADDPGRAFALIESVLEAETRAGRRVIADYTGGTKSMSSALLIAATATEGVGVQFMQGRRTDLVQVADGTERATEPPVHLVMLARDFQAARSFVTQRDYGAALGVIEAMLDGDGGPRQHGAPRSWTKRLTRWKSWTQVLELWDRFEHKEALRLMEPGMKRDEVLASQLAEHGLDRRLRDLAEKRGRPSSLLIEDLWLNAERRAAQKRYDDAIARCYRLMEAAVQARLFERFGLDSSRLPLQVVPPHLVGEGDVVEDPKTGDRYARLGLAKARKLIECRDPKDDLVAGWGDRNPKWLGQRNRSILAHGFSPLSCAQWENEVRPWFDKRKEILWENALGRATAEQLPNWLP